MGDLGTECMSESQLVETEEALQPPLEEVWPHGKGLESWQTRKTSVCERTSHLYNNTEMSDLDILACDENWWFGQTVKDYIGHRFILASASPVLHRLLYEIEKEDSEDSKTKERKLVLDDSVKVTLTLSLGYNGYRLEMDGIPPIAAEALLEYVYKDKFDSSHFANGYSRNLLWRLWHASKAFEIHHLTSLCAKTIDDTMCEDTVFWDLNYSIQYKTLGLGDLMAKVLKLMQSLEERLFEHPNFVWLDQLAVKEILTRRPNNNCEPMVILNNLLRWSLYQIDRSACCEIDDKSNGDIPIFHRIEWIRQCRKGDFGSTMQNDLPKYLSRGLEQMPWGEMSQRDFLEYVVPNDLMTKEDLLKDSLIIMAAAVRNPDRLTKSAFQCEQDTKSPSNGIRAQTNRGMLSRGRKAVEETREKI